MRAFSAPDSVCDKRSGGIKNLYLFPASSVSSIEYDSTIGMYVDIKLNSYGRVSKFCFEQGEATFQEKAQSQDGAMVFAQTIEIDINGAIDETITAINELAAVSGGIIAVVVDANSTQRLVGYSKVMGVESPLMLSSSDASSSALTQDSPYDKATLEAVSPTRAGLYCGDIEMV